MHLAIDGYGADYGKLCDPEFIRRFLDDYPQAIGMTKITEPHVYTYSAPKAEDSGVSGFVIIAESHISVHTFPERGYLNIDIFSCRDFDVHKAEREIVTIFSITSTKPWVLNRGLDHLNPEQMKHSMDQDREQLRIRP